MKSLLEDFDQVMDKETFENSYRQVTKLLLEKHRNLIFGEVNHVFKEITLANYEMKKVSVVNIMACFADYQRKKIEHNRFEIEKRENEIIKNAVDCTRLPLGQAILFRIDMHEKGKNEWWDVPLKEIAQKGEIKFDYKKEKIRTILSNHFTK
ncbi:MAG: hypothetical protein M0P71_11960 [Melioribacteraceae bacterium]|nr:hypothetical protein [Melioribacteraceae bacterium]